MPGPVVPIPNAPRGQGLVTNPNQGRGAKQVPYANTVRNRLRTGIGKGAR